MNKRPDIAYIRRYVNGELSHREMFEIERAAHEDELLMDIIIGLELEKKKGADAHAVQELRHRISDRSREIRSRKTRKAIFWKVVGAAASVVLMLAVGMRWWITSNVVEQPPTLEPSVSIERKSPGPIESETVPSVEEVKVPTAPPRQGNVSRRKGEKTVAFVPDVIELELPQPRRERGGDIPFGVKSIEADSTSVQEETMVAHSKMAGRTISSNVASSDERIMIRGTSAYRRNGGASNITNIPVNEIKSITTGIVVDQHTQEPIVGAAIRDIKSKSVVHTDSTGRFVIASTEEKTDLQVSYVGYAQTAVAANGSVRIELRPNEAVLSEVGAAGEAPKAKEIKSEPVIGARAYRRYVGSLARDARLGKGTVILVFSIDRNGRPSNIRIKQSAGAERDREAIRIIRDGPDWIPGNDSEEVEWKVSF